MVFVLVSATFHGVIPISSSKACKTPLLVLVPNKSTAFSLPMTTRESLNLIWTSDIARVALCM